MRLPDQTADGSEEHARVTQSFLKILDDLSIVRDPELDTLAHAVDVALLDQGLETFEAPIVPRQRLAALSNVPVGVSQRLRGDSLCLDCSVTHSDCIAQKLGRFQRSEHPFLNKMLRGLVEKAVRLLQELDVDFEPLGLLAQVGDVRDRRLEGLDHPRVVIRLEDILPDQGVDIVRLPVGDRIYEGSHAGFGLAAV